MAANRFDEFEESLCVGDVVVLHLHPSKQWGPRYKTVLRGWHRPHQLILDRPTVETRLVQLRKEQPCVVRFLSAGRAIGFKSVVIDWDSRQQRPHCRVAWPEDFEVIRFRRFERVSLEVPCTLTRDGEEFQGQVHDLSIGGCSVCCAGELEDEQEVALSFSLPDGLPIEGLKATVKNVRWCPQGTLCGCRFTDEQEDVASDMAFFVAATLDRFAQFERESRRVLIVDESRDNVTALRKAFEEAHVDVFATSSSLEGLMRLRMVPPNALLVSEGQKDLAPLEMLRLIRGTKGLATLPFCIYSGKSQESQAQADEAGANACFVGPLDAAEVAKVILDDILPPKIDDDLEVPPLEGSEDGQEADGQEDTAPDTGVTETSGEDAAGTAPDVAPPAAR